MLLDDFGLGAEVLLKVVREQGVALDKVDQDLGRKNMTDRLLVGGKIVYCLASQG